MSDLLGYLINYGYWKIVQGGDPLGRERVKSLTEEEGRPPPSTPPPAKSATAWLFDQI